MTHPGGSYRARRPGKRRDNTGVFTYVTDEGKIWICNEQNATEVELTQLHVAVLVDGMLEKALADAEEAQR